VVKSYDVRGAAERWIKEGKNPMTWTRLSCHDFWHFVSMLFFVLPGRA